MTAWYPQDLLNILKNHLLSEAKASEKAVTGTRLSRKVTVFCIHILLVTRGYDLQISKSTNLFT